MKKSKVVMTMAIAIIAIVAVCSVSFAAWSKVEDDTSKSPISVTIAKPVQLVAAFTATPEADYVNKVLAPAGTIVDGGLEVVSSIKLGTITTSINNTVANSKLTVFAYATVKIAETETIVPLVVKIGDTVLSDTLNSKVEIGLLSTAKDITVELPASALENVPSYVGKSMSIVIHFVVAEAPVV